MSFMERIFGNYNAKELKRLFPLADQVMSYEDEYSSLSDDDLKAKTQIFKDRLNNGETLEDILPEAFATVREAAWRTLKQKHFRVQVLGGIVLHQGRIAEMKTGEGKTLAATLPAYLNALTGKGVHIVTVNDYLAKRDSEWMGQVYKFLGLTVGVIIHDMSTEERREAYNSDITYGTNNEFGFDYLRDNMVIYKEEMVQRDFNFAIVDEVDSILIDEARTPLIISGEGDKSTDLYDRANRFVITLSEADYKADEKENTINLTDQGIKKAEEHFKIENLADIENMDINHCVLQALRANYLMKKDKDYVVKDGEIVIVDEFTGRLMLGRRYSDGLHQAIEAKEHVKVQQESKTYATITFQNYFRMYKKLSGMTGTAKTEEQEFRDIYGLDVVVIPTNKPMIRKDLPDVIYKTEKAKFKAVINEIVERHTKGQPILVGTISIEKSEILSQMLKRKGIKHEVLNAKYHEKEAEIIAQAGQRDAVTIATNMAGRGTDIVLGEGVTELGGLHIIGTERHESRRIDNQLRGRSGRQGDPGSSRFYISLEDDLMRLFGSERIMGMMNTLGIEEDMPIENSFLTKQIETAQKKVESRNFDIRKNVLQFDDVMNKQREVIYSERKKVLMGENLKEYILDMVEKIIDDNVMMYTSNGRYADEWRFDDLKGRLEDILLAKGKFDFDKYDKDKLTKDDLKEMCMDIAKDMYDDKERRIKPEQMRELERVILLRVVDTKWMDHIDNMEILKDGIGLRAYGQIDPVVAYQKEGYEMFQDLIDSIQEETVRLIYHVEVRNQEHMPKRESVTGPVIYLNAGEAEKQKPIVKGKKIGRNDPCPCGSGKKYKNCHGRFA